MRPIADRESGTELLTVVNLLKSNDGVSRKTLLGILIEHKGFWRDRTRLWGRHGSLLLLVLIRIHDEVRVALGPPETS